MTNVTALQAHHEVKSGEKLGTITGLAGAVGTYAAAQKFSEVFNDNFIKQNRQLDPTQRNLIGRLAYNALDNSILRKFGVEINDLNSIPGRDLSIEGKNKIFQMFYTKFSPLYKTVKGIGSHYTAYPLGKFGTRSIKANQILVNMKEMPAQVFHEMGHALNSNTSKMWKGIQGTAPMGVFAASCFAVFGALSKDCESKKDNGELTKAQKVSDFIRNNAGKLALISIAPALLEEMVATKKGLIYASKYCQINDKITKTLTQSANMHLAGHLISRLAIPLGGVAGVAIKNHMVEKSKDKARDILMSGE